ncbi:hypothetical protein ACFVXE_04615 [Streptomyces sp. NPDC058231]|uniref:hypothetical protein n=1 Tax=Streptomyces sp. NPDC058231 TaxID=3346392 RepID=UPI0036F13ACF
MQQDDRGTVGRADLGVPDVQKTGSDLLRPAEDGCVPGTVVGSPADFSSPDVAADADAVENAGSEAAAAPAENILENIRLSITCAFLLAPCLSEPPVEGPCACAAGRPPTLWAGAV